jgi:hypothetical protein
MASAKQRLLDYAEANDLTIDHERGGHGGHHLVAYAPRGWAFGGNELDCLCLWDGEKNNPPDWKECLIDLQNYMPLVPNPLPEEDW